MDINKVKRELESLRNAAQCITETATKLLEEIEKEHPETPNKRQIKRLGRELELEKYVMTGRWKRQKKNKL